MPKRRNNGKPPFELFGQRLRAARERMGWNQTAMAYRIGSGQGEASEYENGWREPRLSTILSMCLALGVSADHLIGLDVARRAPRKEP